MESSNAESATEEALNTAQLSEFINTEPAVFLGCTTPELSALLCVSSLLCFPLLGGLGLLLGNFSLGIGAAALGVLLCFALGARLLRHLKRGKPDHHFRLWCMAPLARLGLHRGLVVRSGAWGAGLPLRKVR